VAKFSPQNVGDSAILQAGYGIGVRRVSTKREGIPNTAFGFEEGFVRHNSKNKYLYTNELGVIGEDTAEGTEGGETPPKPENKQVAAADMEFQKEGDKKSEQETDNSYFLSSTYIDDYHRKVNEEQASVHEVRVTNIIYNRIIVIEYILCFFVGFGMALSVMMYEMKFLEEESFNENFILAYNAFCSFVLVLAMYYRYQLYMDWFKSRQLLTEFDTLLSTGWWRKMSVECFLMLLSPYPYL
jgi:hypothetical protein